MNAMKMLRILTMTAALAAPTAMAGWGIGPLVGMNLANPDVDGRGSKSITGWAFGARLETGMLPFLSLMFDPMLVKTGAQFDASSTDASGEGDFVALEIPALLKAQIKILNLGVYGFLGPDLVINTQASGKVTQSEAASAGFAGQVGAGVLIGIAPFVDLTADARYSHGFTDLIDGAKGDIKHWRSRDTRLTLGVLLHTPL